MKISSKMAVIGCFVIMGTLVMFLPQQVQAECFDCSNHNDYNPGPVVSYVGPPSTDRLNQLCIEEWRKSIAFTRQECKGVWVSWDSYRPTSYDLSSSSSEYFHKVFSRCLVNVRCDKGVIGTTLDTGLHNDVLDFFEVNRLRRCRENSGQTMNIHCEQLTEADIQAATEELDESQDQQSYEDEKYGEGYTGEVFGE